MSDPDLHHHGDREVEPGMLDLAVNVRAVAPPGWLQQRLAASLADLGRYPDARPATLAVARHHGRLAEEVLVTAGAAEAFVLLARALSPRHAVVVHPGFTAPEVALRQAGHPVHRLVLPAPDFALDPAAVPDEADLVVVGHPVNPTGLVHDVAALCRPGRVTVVDEAFADALPGQVDSLAGRSDLPGLVVVRSLTKTWSLAGLRVGYLLAPPDLVAALAACQPLWPVSTPALVAVQACLEPAALQQAAAEGAAVAAESERLAGLLRGLGLEVTAGSRAPYLLVRAPGHPQVRDRLRTLGVAVRRGDTFPGLGPEWFRVAVRDPSASDRLVGALWGLLAAF